MSSAAGSSVSSFRKYGIPQNKAPEITLLERLVWVRYQSHWWPALLYHSYTELQQHLYDQLDMVLKAQFAMAIMRQMQEKRKVKVARLLGRSILEVIEVQEDCFCEFYWQLPNVLPKACKLSKYGGNLELYFDFHRALDQVEDIIREVSEQNFALLPNSEQKTWMERAQTALDASQDDQSSVNLLNPLDGTTTTPPKVDPPFVQKAQSIDSKDNSTIETEVGIWDSMMQTISTSFDSTSGQKDEVSPEDNTVEVQKVELPAASVSSSSKRPDPAISEAQGRSKMIAGLHKTRSQSSHHSRSSSSRGSMEKKQSSSVKASSSSSRSVSDTKSRRSVKSKVSEVTAKIDNRSSSKKGFVDETRDPPTERDLLLGATNSNDPNISTALVANNNQIVSPIHLLPGLEGDDIIPGLSAKVENARSVWMNVLGTMVLQKDEDHPQKNNNENNNKVNNSVNVKNSLPEIREESEGSPRIEGFVEALAAEGTPQEEAELAIQGMQDSLTLWQRMTCSAA